MSQASPRAPKGRTFRALSIDIENSSFHAFRLGIENRPWKSMDILRKIQQVFKMAENARKTRFHVFCFFTPLFRCFRLPRVPQREELFELYRLISKILHFMPCGSVSKIVHGNPWTYGRWRKSCTTYWHVTSSPLYPQLRIKSREHFGICAIPEILHHLMACPFKKFCNGERQY